MQLKFADNTTLDGLQNVIAVSSINWENATRKGLQFSFSVDGHTTEEIKAAITDLNKVKSFSTVNGETSTQYDHYIFLVDDSVELVTIPNDSGQDEQRIEFILARQTALEIQVDSLVRDQVGNKIMMGVLESATESAIEDLEG